jgi:hypothetical protein
MPVGAVLVLRFGGKGTGSKRTGKARAGPSNWVARTSTEACTKRSPRHKFTGKGGGCGWRAKVAPGM